MTKKKKNFWLLLIGLLVALGAVFAVFKIVSWYTASYKSNVAADTILYVPTGASFNTIVDSLRAKKVLLNEGSFITTAKREGYDDKARAGRYKIKEGMSNKQLLRKLFVGQQDAVNVVIAGNIRTNEKLAAVLARTIEADSAAILTALSNDTLIQQFGYTPATIIGMIVPNTYQVYWNVSPEKLLQRLHSEYNTFWNEKRTALIENVGLTKEQVVTLASIVNEETNKTDEMPRIAGVYINRLHKGMLLQADPTLKYAWNDFSIKRVLDRHKTIDSPYNTYMYTDLPPGPICVPSIASIDAVLNYERHDYLFFCAKDDFSGYHAFAKTLSQHNQNADKYRRALDRNMIFR